MGSLIHGKKKLVSREQLILATSIIGGMLLRFFIAM